MLAKVWKKWLEISEKIGNVTARIFLTVFYFVLFALPAVFLTFIFDKVGKKFGENSYFVNEKIKLNNIDEAREM